MDRRSWLWRRRSTEKSPAETESSASSLSERLTDEQDTLKEVSSKEVQDESNEKVKALSEKLSSAVLDIRAKDDLVKQHSKVAEEAVLGWEKAEKEIASLKAQLNAAVLKSSTLEDRVVHLDGALKECVRQLRRGRGEQEQKVHDACALQAREWESKKTDLDLKIIELKAKLEAKSELSTATDSEANSRLAALEKQNSALQAELLAKTEEVELRAMEKELNRRAAETASKQQLESIKKVAKLEAECRKLQAAARRSSFSVELRHAPSSVCAESVTDCQSDCADSWASALITELDQFKNDKSSSRGASLANADIGLMDDFLEMERLASTNGASRGEGEDVSSQLGKLEEKVKKLTGEKADKEKALHEAQRELRVSRHRTTVAEEKSAELQRQLNLVNGEKHAMEAEVEALERKRGELESKLELAHVEIANLTDKGRVLEERIEAEKTLTLELAAKYQHMDALEAERKELHLQLEASQSQAKKFSDKAALLERTVEEEKVISARLAAKCCDMEALEAKKKSTELELESSREEIALLQKKLSCLELKVEEEKALSAEFACRNQDLEAMGVERNELNSQLETANLQIAKLNEKASVLERTIEKQKLLTEELECKLKSAQAEIKNLRENVSLLEKLESQKNLSSVYIAALDASEAQKAKLASRVELGKKEAEELRGKIGLLEEQVRKERALSLEFAARCQNLQDQLSRSTRGHPPVQPMVSADLQMKKENELARAAGKLADCQKTIASLRSQLKALADCDDFLPGAEDNGTSAEGWDGDLKLFNSANYPEHLGCLAVT